MCYLNNLVWLVTLLMVAFLGTVLGCATTSSSSSNSIGSRSNIHDKQGYYKGYVNEKGQIFDKQGYYEGRIDNKGFLYDKKEYYQGKVDYEE